MGNKYSLDFLDTWEREELTFLEFLDNARPVVSGVKAFYAQSLADMKIIYEVFIKVVTDKSKCVYCSNIDEIKSYIDDYGSFLRYLPAMQDFSKWSIQDKKWHAALWEKSRKASGKIRFAPGVLKSLFAEDAQIHAAKQARLWRELAATLENKEEETAARATACKWKGMTHIEAYDTLFPGSRAKDETKKQKVSRLKKSAQTLAKTHGLELPECWREQEKAIP